MGAEAETQGERPWDALPLPEGWPTSWPLAFPPNYADPPRGRVGSVRWDVERAEAEGWRVLTVVPQRGHLALSYADLVAITNWASADEEGIGGGYRSFGDDEAALRDRLIGAMKDAPGAPKARS